MTELLKIGKGEGYKREDGALCMIRCFECGLENYAPAVHSGKCAWCGHDADGKTGKEK